VYVAVGTLTTAGTGIVARTELARLLLTLQRCVDITLVTVLIGVVIHRLTPRNAPAAGPAEPAGK
jgi:hypothetical protein